MKEMKNRGLGSSLHSWLCSLRPGTAFPLDAAIAAMKPKHPEAGRMAVSNALSWLAKKGLVQPGELRGTYVKTHSKDGSDPEAAIIDNLLDAMAKAEPIIRRWQRVQAALDSVR